MKKRGKKVFHLVLILIVTNALITEGSKQFYSEDLTITYYWFDLSNYLRYVVTNSIILALMFVVRAPIQLRLFMMIYVIVSIKDAVTYIINGNTGTVLNDVWIIVAGLLVILYKTVVYWKKKDAMIILDDPDNIYRITDKSESITGTILSFIGDDCETVRYYSFRWMYKFSRKTDKYTKLQIQPCDIKGTIEKIPCDSVKFCSLMDEKIGTKYDKYKNNCENITNDAKKSLGLKTRKFPQLK